MNLIFRSNVSAREKVWTSTFLLMMGLVFLGMKSDFIPSSNLPQPFMPFGCSLLKRGACLNVKGTAVSHDMKFVVCFGEKFTGQK